MTRKSILYGVGLVAMVLVFACSGKKEETAEHGHHEVTGESWKEMDDFHMVMAESFHPYKDSMNLEPAKLKAAEMAASAEKWLAAPLPEKVNNDEMKSKLESLKAETLAFVETVGKGDDKRTAEALTKLHDSFHEIQEAWYGGHGDHHH